MLEKAAEAADRQIRFAPHGRGTIRVGRNVTPAVCRGSITSSEHSSKALFRKRDYGRLGVLTKLAAKLLKEIGGNRATVVVKAHHNIRLRKPQELVTRMHRAFSHGVLQHNKLLEPGPKHFNRIILAAIYTDENLVGKRPQVD